MPLLVLASCPVENRPAGSPRLTGLLKIRTVDGTLAAEIYGQPEVSEDFNCNYELNPEYRGVLESSGLVVSGVSDDGGARIIELPGLPFYLATGFVPQMLSQPGSPHPLITAFLRVSLRNRERREGR